MTAVWNAPGQEQATLICSRLKRSLPEGSQVAWITGDGAARQANTANPFTASAADVVAWVT